MRMTSHSKQNKQSILLYSGGKGSFLTAYLLKQKEPETPIIYYFNDTFYEHSSLYVFLDETLAWLHNKKPLRSYVNIPPERATRVFSKEMQSYYEGFVYDSHKQSLFELINHTRFMPNSRIDSCSKALKRRKSQSWIKKNFKNPDDVSIYVGIGIWEEHRVKRAAKNWEPYQLSSPLVNYQVLKRKLSK